MSRTVIATIYDRLIEAAGPRGWWPGEGRDEIIIGAVLTQNTAWRNVEKALDNLKAAKLCRLSSLARRRAETIARLIVPSGYFNLKARRLKSVARFFAPGGRERFDELSTWPTEKLREALLGVWGVGPETADSILLYALGRPSFVIDAYTMRVARRHGLCNDKTTYAQAQRLFSEALPTQLQLFNEYHALVVWVGHRFCKPKPLCSRCPLSERDCFVTARAWNRLKAAQKESPEFRAFKRPKSGAR